MAEGGVVVDGAREAVKEGGHLEDEDIGEGDLSDLPHWLMWGARRETADKIQQTTKQ